MELNTFVSKFEKQLDDVEPETLTGDTVFRDIEEWDSMTALTIIAMVDEEYAVKLTGNDIKGSETIEDLYNIIKSKK